MSPGVRVPPLLVLLLILHTAVFPQFRVLDVGADILLVVAIAGGMAGGPERGAVVGFLAGLLADLFLQTPFGLSALAYCLVGWGVGTFQTTILHATWWIPVLTAMVASAGGTLLYVLFGVVVGQDQLLSWRLASIIVVVALANGILCPVVVRVVRWALGATPRSGLMLR